jgi:hypothetical protein
MRNKDQSEPPTEVAIDVVDRIVQYLLHKPYDLIDSRRLMALFEASADDFQCAFQRIEQMAFVERGEKSPG